MKIGVGIAIGVTITLQTFAIWNLYTNVQVLQMTQSVSNLKIQELTSFVMSKSKINYDRITEVSKQ